MLRPSSPSSPRRARATAVAVAATATAALAGAFGTSASADLQSRIGASQAKDRQLQQGIAADASHIQGFQGRIDDLRQRLDLLQGTLTGEEEQLTSLQTSLRHARAHLTILRLRYVQDRRTLARQLVGQYEAPKPSLVDVVLHAHGFADLLELADQFRELSQHNATVAGDVKAARTRVGLQTDRLTELEARQERVTQALQAQRDEIAQLKLAVVNRQLVYVRARSAKSAELTSLRANRGRLEKQLAAIQAKNARIFASAASGSGPGLPSGGAPAFTAHAGAYGFFQAPGTNYSVGDTPRIAARLDVMGKALHLHLIGISGYRTPQHSVEVGGFANDPHTRGQASDTPGLEGVPEATLNKYGLTRPFGGAAELDHVQLLGSI